MYRIPIRIFLALVIATLAAAPAGAQSVDRAKYHSWVDTTFAFARGGLVDAGQVAGDVIVTTWDRPEVRVLAYAEHGTVRTSISRDRVSLRVEGEQDGRNRRIGDSRFELTVPVGTRVKLASVSGDVRVKGTRAEVEATSVSGDVSVSDAEGLTSVNSVSGDVTVARVKGDLSVQSVSGDVDVRDVTGDVRASTVSGEIDLRAIRARAVSAKTTSGEIGFDGALERGGRYELRSHSGSITLRLPADAAADVSLSTFSGSLDTDFPITLGGREAGRSRVRSGRDMEFTLGAGGARLSVQTFSGDVRLARPR